MGMNHVQAHADDVAIINASGGDPTMVKNLFANECDLKIEGLSLIPHADLTCAEAQRLAAAEDRPYHGVTMHPAYAGGYSFQWTSMTKNMLNKSTCVPCWCMLSEIILDWQKSLVIRSSPPLRHASWQNMGSWRGKTFYGHFWRWLLLVI